MEKINHLNTLTCVSAGVFAGGTLMVELSFGFKWQDLLPEELLFAFPNDWKHIATTIIPFALLQTFLFPIALYLSWQNKAARLFWLLALGLWLANCTITSVYHFPIVLKAIDGNYDVSQISQVVEQWLIYHWPRVLLGFATAYFAVLAAVKSQRRGDF